MNIVKPDLQVHFMDCGQGNMTLLIFPDETTVLYDCRVTEENEASVLQYLKTYLPMKVDEDGDDVQRIDWFFNSHRDNDHFLGLQRINAQFPIRGIADSGTTSGSTEGDANTYYMGLRRYLRETLGTERVVEPRASTSPIADFGGAKIYCLCSGIEDELSEDGHYGNLVISIEFAGNRILLTGDSDWRSWQEKIMPVFDASGILKSTVLVASHHGSKTFFIETEPQRDGEENWDEAYTEHLESISPLFTVISCGDQSICNHPNEKAKQLYLDNTANKQVYLTREKETLVGQFYCDGRWTVTPSRFMRGWRLHDDCPPGKSMDVSCVAIAATGTRWAVQHDAVLPVGIDLEFTVTTTGGLAGDMKKVRYFFEVSNGGFGDHADHDEIYWPSKKEAVVGNKFKRQLSYEGIHLLRAIVRGGGNGLRAQKVFRVHAAKVSV